MPRVPQPPYTHLLHLSQHGTGGHPARQCQQNLQGQQGQSAASVQCPQHHVPPTPRVPSTFSPGKMTRFLPSIARNLCTKYSRKQELQTDRQP